MRRTILAHDELVIGQRVYVRDLDVFGQVRIRAGRIIVLCENPMTNYVHEVTAASVLYDDSIGDRD